MEIDDFLCRPGGLGYVVDRARFDARLRAAAANVGVTFVAGRVATARRDAGKMMAQVKTGTVDLMICADVTVDASGRPSLLARRFGARRLLSERLIAERRVADQSLDPRQEPAWLDVEGFERNWSYCVSGPNGRSEVWTIHRDNGRSGCSAGQCANASSARLSYAAGDHWVAIGDAAASFDPITSQGLVNALTTSLVAAGAILSSRGLDEEAARIYSGAVPATFRNSEIGRTAVYDALTR